MYLSSPAQFNLSNYQVKNEKERKKKEIKNKKIKMMLLYTFKFHKYDAFIY